ncbi:MAG: pyridoxamine 5'-phosphate oxidase family protein [Anaerolineales bacterium]|nr:pyridoxamine 5'-phosphate oxidase family protein [Anaerolineales bacterium]
MPENDAAKQAQIAELLEEPVLARLGTSNGKTCQPHIVPVWFLWDGESIWISAFDSTRKVKDLKSNQRCAVLIEPKDPQNGRLQALLLEGKAELVTEPRQLVQEMSIRIYTKYMGPEGVLAAEPQSWSVDPENTLVRLKPQKTYHW